MILFIDIDIDLVLISVLNFVLVDNGIIKANLYKLSLNINDLTIIRIINTINANEINWINLKNTLLWFVIKLNVANIKFEIANRSGIINQIPGSNS